MKNKFIWLKNRLNLLIFLTIDTIIFFSSKIFISSSQELILFSNLFFFFSWIFGNYVFGKYNLKDDSFYVYIFKNLFNFINVSLLSYLLLVPLEGIASFRYSSYINILKINIFSFIFIILFNLIFKNIKTDNPLIFICDSNTIEILKEELKFSNKSKNVIFINKINFNKELINSRNIIIEDSDYKLLSKIYLGKKSNPILLSKWIEKYLQRYPIALYGEEFSNNIFFSDLNTYQFRLKRLCEFVFSLLLIILTSPIVLIASIAIYLEDKGPIFYSQNRTGYLNKIIRIQKLRTLKIQSEKNGPQWISKNDSRITKVGQILRKLRIDELPQLISVLKGEMALIGPRPERPQIDCELEKKINHYRKRYFLKPGLSGWAQVNYPYGASVRDAEIKLSYDLYYLRNYSNFLDILIFIKTIKMILNGKGSIPKLDK